MTDLTKAGETGREVETVTCRFCRAIDSIRINYGLDIFHNEMMFVAHCPDCGACSESHMIPADAMAEIAV